MLEGTADGRVGEADGDGAEGAGVELGVPLHDIEGALWGKGIVLVVDTGHDFAFFDVGVRGDGEAWAFNGSVGGLGSWCTREWDGRWVDQGDGGSRELGSDRVLSDGGLDVVERGVGLDGGRHVGLV